MKGKFFLDTNILVYTFDERAPAKRKLAQKLVETALLKNNGVISYQVVQEFLNVATKKFVSPFTPEEAKLYLKEVLLPLCEFYPNNDFFSRALEIKKQTRFSFYDSLIVTAAIETDSKILYSEDLQDGYAISGLTIKNPF